MQKNQSVVQTITVKDRYNESMLSFGSPKSLLTGVNGH